MTYYSFKNKKIRTKKSLLLNYKEFFLTSAIIIVCLVLSIVFPTTGFFQDLTRGFFFLFLAPILYLKFILKKKIKTSGLNLKNKKVGIIWGSAMLVISLVSIFTLIKLTNFSASYRISAIIINNFWFFTLYMFVLANFILFIQEYFFRGFILNTFREETGKWSVVIQALIYLIVVIIQKGFNANLWQMVPMLILALTGGITAYKSKSMIYSYISGLLFFIILNSYLIHLIKIK